MEKIATISMTEECNKDLILGQVVQAVNNLILTNQEDHQKIFDRLDEGDKYLAPLKISRCSLEWLNRNDFFKYGALAALFTFTGWLISHARL